MGGAAGVDAALEPGQLFSAGFFARDHAAPTADLGRPAVTPCFEHVLGFKRRARGVNAVLGLVERFQQRQQGRLLALGQVAAEQLEQGAAVGLGAVRFVEKPVGVQQKLQLGRAKTFFTPGDVFDRTGPVHVGKHRPALFDKGSVKGGVVGDHHRHIFEHVDHGGVVNAPPADHLVGDVVDGDGGRRDGKARVFEFVKHIDHAHHGAARWVEFKHHHPQLDHPVLGAVHAGGFGVEHHAPAQRGPDRRRLKTAAQGQAAQHPVIGVALQLLGQVFDGGGVTGQFVGSGHGGRLGKENADCGGSPAGFAGHVKITISII